MLLFPFPLIQQSESPFFEKLEKQKTRSFYLRVFYFFRTTAKKRNTYYTKQKNILIFSYRNNSYFKIINRNECDLSNVILHTLFYLSTKMNDHNNVFQTYFARYYFNYSSL